MLVDKQIPKPLIWKSRNLSNMRVAVYSSVQDQQFEKSPGYREITEYDNDSRMQNSHASFRKSKQNLDLIGI